MRASVLGEVVAHKRLENPPAVLAVERGLDRPAGVCTPRG